MGLPLILINIFLFIAIVLSAYFLSYAYVRRELILGKYLAFTAGAILLYVLAYTLEINSATLEQMIFWNYVQSIGIPFIAPLWIIVIYTYIYRKEIPFKYRIALFVIPIFVLLVRFTNDLHQLYYSSMTLEDSLWFQVMVLGKGPLYYIQFAYIFLCISSSIVLTIISFSKENQEKAMISRRLILAATLPWVGGIINVWPLGYLGIDFSALFMPLALLAFGTIVHKKHFLSLKEVILNRFLNDADEGFIVFDNYNMLFEVNNFAKSRFPNIVNYMHKSIYDIINDYPRFRLILQETRVEQFLFNDSYYRINRSPLYDNQENFVGTVITFSDITEQVLMIQSLQEKQKEISYLTLHDQLTNLHNRIFLHSYLKYLQASDHPMGIILVRLQNLREINELFGHTAGDEAIKKMATIIKSNSGEYDQGIRSNGDEFILLVPQIQEKDLLDKTNKISEQYQALKGIEIIITCGIKQLNQTFDDIYRSLYQKLRK